MASCSKSLFLSSIVLVMTCLLHQHLLLPLQAFDISPPPPRLLSPTARANREVFINTSSLKAKKDKRRLGYDDNQEEGCLEAGKQNPLATVVEFSPGHNLRLTVEVCSLKYDAFYRQFDPSLLSKVLILGEIFQSLFLRTNILMFVSLLKQEGGVFPLGFVEVYLPEQQKSGESFENKDKQLLEGDVMPPFIAGLCVNKDYRRKGIAKALIAECESAVLSRGYETLSLKVESKNVVAKSLYESNGYSNTGANPAAKMLVGDLLFGKTVTVHIDFYSKQLPVSGCGSS